MPSGAALAGSEEAQQPRASVSVGLVSGDLMVVSRLTALARGLGFTLQTVRPGAAITHLDLVLVDLNRDPEGQIVRLAGLLAERPGIAALCFGPHLQLAQLKPRARAAGAQRCVANSALLLAVDKAVVAIGQRQAAATGGGA